MIEKPRTRCHLQKAPWTPRLPKENTSSIPKDESSAFRRKSNRLEQSHCKCFLRDDALRSRLTGRKKSDRRPSHSDTESLSDYLKMPVETTNSVLKNSFSLTSLRPCTTSDSPDAGMRMPLKNERLYHSLTKQPRQRQHQLEKEIWRKSWGSFDGQDDNPLSEAFQADYDYLMSQHILEKDAEERNNSTPKAPLGWSLSELNEHYAQLHSWLTGIRDSLDFSGENVGDWKSRAERLETLQRQRYRLDNFNEESRRLMEQFPHLEPEISNYVKFINKLWESVESLAGGLKFSDGQRRKEEESRESLKKKIHCLRKWMRELKTKLKPLNFQRTWTKAELEVLAEEHAALHHDIESHGYVVSSVEKLCEKVDSSSLAAARALQRKYYEYLLKSFEWKCYIETLQPNKVPSIVNDSDGEPGAKKLKFDHERDLAFNGSFRELTDNDPSLSDYLENDFSEEDEEEEEEDLSMVGTDLEKPKDQLGLPNPSPKSKNRGTYEDRLGSAMDKNMRTVTRKQNTATIHCKHSDTEQENSDVDKENQLEVSADAKDVETTSSEDCLTYMSVGSRETSEEKQNERLDFGDAIKPVEKPVKYLSAKNIAMASWNARQNSNESIIQELVERADEMVRCRSTNSLEGKSSRTRMRAKAADGARTLDSYDASSEYTAEDSDDLEGSVGTCRRSGSAEGILNDPPGPKQFEVVMRNSRHKNKTRPSSMSCVPSYLGQRISSNGTQLSVSESALNQVSTKEYLFGREKKLQWHEEGSGSLRRPRRVRTRRRSIFNRRSDPCVENAAANGGDPQQRSSSNKQVTNLKGLVKSGSFSSTQPDQARTSDSRSGTETDEESTRLPAQGFRLGPEGGKVTIANERTKIEGEEPLSLNSDQVDWDDYQEKYQSEAYSEDPPDPDLVKNMTEFGEDYRKYLDSQSECEESRKFIRQRPEKSSPWGSPLDECFSSSTLFDETIGTCDKFLHCPSMLADCDAAYLEKLGLVDGLRTLRKKCDPNRGFLLREEMAFLKNELRRLAMVVDETEATLTTREELETKIEHLKGKLNAVRELKCKLRPLNSSVHRFLLDTGQPAAFSSLREDVEDLYLVWHNTFERISSKLCTMQSILQIWIECEELLAQFQCTLPSDRDTLQTLELALCDGPCSEIGLSVKNVARALFDKDSSKNQFVAKSECPLQQPVLASLSTEGSLSDSGISDSGSEQGMSEREKKLARLKRLQKLLESILAPESPGLADITRRIEQAELELRRLQKKCRELFERTGAAVDDGNKDMDFRALPAALGMPAVGAEEEQEEVVVVEEEEGDGGFDSDEEPYPGGKSWFWRVVRAALPFHIALVALLCMAYLLEPHCCDTLNNLGVTFTRQLRNRHPPPT